MGACYSHISYLAWSYLNMSYGCAIIANSIFGKFWDCEFSLCAFGSIKLIVCPIISSILCHFTCISWYSMLMLWKCHSSSSLKLALLNHLLGHRSKKTSKLCITGLCERNPPMTGGFSQRASKVQNVTIWWHHHDVLWKFLHLDALNSVLVEIISVHKRSFISYQIMHIEAFHLGLVGHELYACHSGIWCTVLFDMHVDVHVWFTVLLTCIYHDKEAV